MIDHNLVSPADLWYIVGYITADGNLSADQRHINITSKDLDHLESIKGALHLKSEIIMKARGGSSEKKYGFLQFSDVKFYRFLLKIGLSTKKSLTLGPLNIPLEQFSNFLRGVVDGDGNIRHWVHPSNEAEQWSLRIYSAAPKFIHWLYAHIQEQFQVKGILVRNNGKSENNLNPVYVAKFGKMAAQVILKNCYSEGALALPRKVILAKQCLLSCHGWQRSLTVKVS
jgi:hypothetical protein